MKKINQHGIVAHIVLLAVILILGVGATGLLVWKSAHEKKVVPEASTVLPTDKKMSQVVVSMPDGFVTYENKELGFSFAYPKEWGTIDVRFDGSAPSSDLFLALFSGMKESGKNLNIELRGHSASVNIENSDSTYAKGYVLEGGQYYTRGGTRGNFLIKESNILAKVPSGLGDVLIVRNDENAGPYIYPEIHVNLPHKDKIVGLKLSYISVPDPDPGQGQAYTAEDVVLLKKVAATFDKR